MQCNGLHAWSHSDWIPHVGCNMFWSLDPLHSWSCPAVTWGRTHQFVASVATFLHTGIYGQLTNFTDSC